MMNRVKCREEGKGKEGEKKARREEFKCALKLDLAPIMVAQESFKQSKLTSLAMVTMKADVNLKFSNIPKPRLKLCRLATQLLLVPLICDIAKQICRPPSSLLGQGHFCCSHASAQLLSSQEQHQHQQQQASSMRRQPANKEQPFGE